MGALVTISSPVGLAALDLPWVVTVGPLGDDEDWEPVMCGPYARAHALALGQAVVVDDELMAVVEPVQPHLRVADIQAAVADARAAATAAATAGSTASATDLTGDGVDSRGVEQPGAGAPSVAQVRAGFERIAKMLRSV